MSKPELRRKQIDLTLSQGSAYGSINSADLQNSDIMEDAFSKVVNILDALVPPAAPNLSLMSFSPTGVTAKISFGTGNAISGYDNHPSINENGTVTVSSTTMGIIKNRDITGTLANGSTAGPGTPNAAYPSNSFGNADKGTLYLELDGVNIHSVDLTSFVSGSTLNGNGSGFNLSVATASKFPQGTIFETFKSRTGTFTLNKLDYVGNYGYKTLRVYHVVGTSTYSSQTYNFIADGYSTPLPALSSPSLSSLNMSGSKYISGVNYHTSGTALYGGALSNVYKNTYSSSSTAISHPGTSNCSIPSTSIPAFTGDENDVIIMSKTATISSGIRIINTSNTSISANTNILVPDSSSVTSTTISNFKLLYDNITDNSLDIDNFEYFKGETHRVTNEIETNKDTTTGWVSGGGSTFDWDSTQSLVGGNVYHNNGLIVFNGSLRYPTNTVTPASGNFTLCTDGQSSLNYSTATGNRVYYRQFYFALNAQNFVMRVAASTTTTTVVNAGSVSGNGISIELLAPSQTKTSGVTAWKDCSIVGTDVNSVGCYASTYGSNLGSVANGAWGLTIFSKNTDDSGKVIILKITTSSSWTGNISQLELSKFVEP